jgi:MFS family permease
MTASLEAGAVRRRDFRVIGLVGLAHALSHLYQLALPPLFPLINRQEGYSFAQLGIVSLVMYLTSALLQTPAGFLVDRFGARKVLLAGIAVMGGATALYGLIPSYEAMLVAAVLAGAGNSVFHPCDYSVMSATVSEGRMGRAFSLHMFGGYIGYGLAPILLAFLGEVIGWRAAVIAAGLLGFLALIVLVPGTALFRDSRHVRAREPKLAAAPSLGESGRLLFKGPILLCWVFFLVVAMGQVGLQNGSPSILSLPTTFDLDLKLAGSMVTLMLFSVPVGILIGGALVDRTTRPDLIVAVGYAFAAVMMLLLWRLPLDATAIAACYIATGLVYGAAFPSRDLLVRRSTPKGASGKVLGFVYSGMDFGSLVTPVAFGWLIDTGQPRLAFLCVAVLWVAGIFLLRATTASATRLDTSPATVRP